MLLAFTKRSTPDTFAGYVSVASQDGAISPPLRVRMLPSLLLFPLVLPTAVPLATKPLTAEAECAKR